MSLSGTSVGIDYHQQSLQVAVMSSDGRLLGNRRLSNDVGEVISYVAKFGAVQSVAIEACTGSANFAHDLRNQSTWEVRLCHPGYVQRMRHNPDKTDKSDGFLLSDLNRVGYLPEVWLAPEEIQDLRTMVRYRKQLVEQRKEAKLRIRAILRQHRIKKPSEIRCWWTKSALTWLGTLQALPAHTLWVLRKHLGEHERVTTAIGEAETRLAETTTRDMIVRNLKQIKGVGLVGACTIRAEIGTVNRFRTGKQLARFCGVTPRNCSSGERQADAGLIKAGNPGLKTAIIEICNSLVRHNTYWREFALRLSNAGKPYGVVVGAVANRWVRQLYHELKRFEQQPLA